MSASVAIVCEVSAPDPRTGKDLAQIAQTCARDVGQRVILKRTGPSDPGAEAAVTLHLPVEFAVSQHEAWCLACRLACFCPGARVSVLVEGAFAAKQRTHGRRRRSA